MGGTEDLDISRCHKLESLPEGLGQLKKLKSLKINCCDKLKSLPHSFGQLERDTRGKEVLIGPRFHTSPPSTSIGNGSKDKEGVTIEHIKEDDQ
ncbi:hypothetical protein ACLOJK_038009 [Asimina triloba]